MNPKPLMVVALLAAGGCSEFELRQKLEPDLPTTGPAPAIRIDPEAHDFGSPWIGCALERAYTIHNDGDADLLVDDLVYESGSPELTFAHALTLPITLAPGDFVTASVSYLGADTTDDFSELVARSNDPVRPEASATAHGVARSDRVTERFDQPTQAQADILVVVDNSTSMAAEQAGLTTNFQSFIDAVVAANTDYRIGVLTTDDPSFRGPMITPATADPAGVFASQASAGTSGSGIERPMQMVFDATQPGGDAAPGGGFFRDEAVLSIVVVTDEPDSSPAPPTESVDYLVGLKGGDASLVKVHVIGGDVPVPACLSAAMASRPLDEVATESGGLFLSVCSNWGDSLDAVAAGSVPLYETWALGEPAQAGTIEVTVDGVPSTGWSYDPARNAIVFDTGATPPEGAVVEIGYEPVHDCEP